MKNLKSSVNKVGEVVTQIVSFTSGEQKTFENIITKTIKVGMFTKFETTDGKMIAVNHNKVNWFETHK